MNEVNLQISTPKRAILKTSPAPLTVNEKQKVTCCSNESLQNLRYKKGGILKNSSKIQLQTEFMELGESSFIKQIQDKNLNKELYSKFHEDFKKIIVDNEGNYLYTKVPKETPREFMKTQKNSDFLMNNKEYSSFIEKKIQELSQGKEEIEKSQSNLTNSSYFIRRSLRKSIDSPTKKKRKATKDYIHSLKEESYQKISDFLNLKNKSDVINNSKKEIDKIIKEYTLIIEKITKENQILQEECGKMRIHLEETVELSDFLKRKNVILSDHLKLLQMKYEEQLNMTSELEEFSKGMKILQEKFPSFTLEKLMNRYELLEETSLNLTKKLGEYEDDVKKMENERSKERQQTQEKMFYLIENEKKKEKEIQDFQIRLNIQKFDKQDAFEYKEKYFLICNRIISLFNKWNNSIRVYYNSKEQKEDENMVLDDPLNLIDILDKMVQISTPESLQAYLRKIIISANKLQRKHFKKFVNERFNPEKLFERIDKKMEQLQKAKTILESSKNKIFEKNMEKIFLD